MADLLISGRDRPPRRWLRVVLTLAVAVGGAVYLVVRASGGPSRQPASPTRSATPTGAPTTYPVDVPPLATKTGVRLYATGYLEPAGETLTRIDLDTGRAVTVSGVPRKSKGKLFVLPIAGGVAVTGPACSGCTYALGEYVYVVHGLRSVRRFRIDGQAMPAASGTALWVQRGGPDEPATVQRIDLHGRTTSPRYRLPNSEALTRETVGGLLLVGTASPHRAEVWSPVTGTTLLRFGTYVAASSSMLAWTDPGCKTRCSIHVTDLRRGVTRTVTEAVGPHATGTFSPDGRMLSLDESRRARVDVVDLHTRRLQHLEYGPTDVTLMWSNDSRWLVITTTQPGSRPNTDILIWRRGMDRPARAATGVLDDQFVAG